MDPKTQANQENINEWNKFPMPNTIPAGWDVSAFTPVEQPVKDKDDQPNEKKKDAWS